MRETNKTKSGKISKTILPPTKKEIVFCISLYFGVPAKFNRYNILYKTHLSKIVEKRNFLLRVQKPDKPIFEEWLSSEESKINLSRKYFEGNTSKGRTAINRNLARLIAEIMQDFENGLLAVQPYEKPIKPNSRAHFKKLNEDLKALGMTARIPLRKKSNREILADYEKHTRKL